MPLPIPQQIFAKSPKYGTVSGKALRQEYAMNEQEMELRDLQIQNLKDPKPDPEETRDQSIFVQESLANAGAAALIRVRDNPDSTPEEITTTFTAALTQSLGKETAAEIKSQWDTNGDGVFGTEEWIELTSFTTSYMKGLEVDGGTKPTSENFGMVGPNGETVATGQHIVGTPEWESAVRDQTQFKMGALAQTQQTKEAGGVSDNDYSKALVDFRNKAIGAAVGINSAIEMVKIANTTPAALGKSGAITSFGNEMLSTAKGLLDVFGKEALAKADKARGVTEEDRTKVNQGWQGFEKEFEDIDISSMGLTAIEAAKFKAGVYGIAFAFAVSEQGTRPTDKDIQQFIAQHGGNLTNPDAFKGTIAQFIDRQDNLLHSYADIMMISPEDQASAFNVWDQKRATFESALGGDAASTGLKVGDVDGDYTYLGGDPSLETSWKLN